MTTRSITRSQTSSPTKSLTGFGGSGIASIPKLQWALDGTGYADDLLDGIPVLASRGGTTLPIALSPPCFDFNGTNQYLETAMPDGMDFPLAIGCWVRTTATAGTIATLCSTDANNEYIALLMQTGGFVKITARNGSESQATGSVSINDGEWHHVMGVWINDDLRILYIDGVEDTRNTVTRSLADNNLKFSIGRLPILTPAVYLDGEIANVRLYDFAPSINTIKMLANTGPNTFPFPLDFDNWDLGVEIIETDSGYVTTFDADDHSPTTDETFYVDAETGNDANNGLSPETAKATVNGAIAASSGVPLIRVAPGTYNVSSTWPDDFICEKYGTGTVTFETSLMDIPNGSEHRFSGITFKEYVETLGGVRVYTDCRFEDSGEDAISFRGSGQAFLKNCVATNATNDGFDYRTTVNAIEIDCRGIDNGTEEADNGSTAHDSSRVVRVNGVYTGNYRNIHDVQASKSLNFGCTVNTSVGADNENDSFNVGAGFSTISSESCKVWLFGCNVSGGANVDIHGDTDSNIYVDAATVWNTKSTNATVTEITVETPQDEIDDCLVAWEGQQGSGNTGYNSASNAYHGTGSTGWSNCNKVRDACVLRGGRMESAVFVPMLFDETTAANGSAKVLQKFTHSPNTLEDRDPTDSELLEDHELDTLIAVSEDTAADRTPLNAIFRREKVDGSFDRLITVADTLTDKPLEIMEAYTS